MALYNRGTELKLTATFRDENDALTDPDEVELSVRPPSGTVTSYQYSEAEVTRESQGVYSKRVTLDAVGTWRWRVAGTGAIIAADWSQFQVEDDPFN